jgi:serine/threonine protein kinase/Flp pilus assembly protein TadD
MALELPAMSLLSGSTLGPYEILGPLGAGGMGEVYRARDGRLGREVAIKVLPDAVARDPSRLSRFEREARTVASLNHPGVVTLYSVEEANGIRFLTMELVDGQPLSGIVVPGGLPVIRVIDIGMALVEALHAAHEKGVVHRDLKPANVMVMTDGRIKVLDFGLAKSATEIRTSEETQAMTLESPVSTAGLVVGTVPYMAPEQVRGESMDRRSDLFSLGIILYELVTGVRPFTGTTSPDVSSSILRDIPTPVDQVRGSVPRELARIVSRCLEKDPEHRFQSAKDVKIELSLVRREMESGSSSSARALPKVPAAPAQDLPSIAVLPFANRSRDEEDEYFSDGLADELLSVLARIRGLRVAARTSSASFKGRHVTIADIGRSLGVATVLEGSVRKAGNRVRISVQLVKVADGYHLWSETYDRMLDDIFAVQDDIAQSVVKELRTTLLGEAPDSKASGEVKAEVAAAARGRGDSSEAHRLYLQGKFFIDRMNKNDVTRGIQTLTQALALEPDHALAWVELSGAHTTQGGYGWAPLAESLAGAKEAARRAIAIAPELAEAHTALGRIQTMFEWDWLEAQRAFRRALELAPTNAAALRGAAGLSHFLGRLDEAIDFYRRALDQDPLSAVGYSQLGHALRVAGRDSEAEAAFRKALEIAPQRITAHMVLGLILSAQGRLDEAIDEARLEPESWARDCCLAIVLESAGRGSEARQHLAKLIEESSDNSAYQIAAVYTFHGDVDRAFEWLERAWQQRDPGLPFMKCEPLFGRLHSDPRWVNYLRKVRLID